MKAKFGYIAIIFSLLFLPSAKAQEVQVIKFEDLESLIKSSTDSLIVINFWATWCKPCVKELPCFYELNAKRAHQGIKTILVSLDFKRQLETTLKPFLSKRGEGPLTFLLDEPDYDLWINKVDANWTGAIPATMLINPKNRKQHFHEGEITCEDLNRMVNEINKND